MLSWKLRHDEGLHATHIYQLVGMPERDVFSFNVFDRVVTCHGLIQCVTESATRPRKEESKRKRPLVLVGLGLSM